MYKLENLPYLFQDLEPFIDTHTLGLHYNKHAQNYLNNLNKLLTKNNFDYRYDINELVFHINEFAKEDQESILFNLGGVINHTLYWKSMSNKKSKKIEGKLKEKVKKTFGSEENFWKLFKEEALKLKGSGYTFLILKSNGELEIMNFSNQDMPLSYGYIPLFNVDLWEHAYYLNYENDKSKYLDSFIQIADFTFANKIYNNIVINL